MKRNRNKDFFSADFYRSSHKSKRSSDNVKSSVKVAPCLYDTNTIDQLEWPKTPEGQLAKGYFVPLVKNGVGHYIENVNARMCILNAITHVLPVLIVDDDYENSNVCSPYGFYILSALRYQEHFFSSGFLRMSFEKFIKGLGKILMRGKINKIIFVNNWLFTTDLHSKDISEADIKTITTYLKEKFPQHAIAFRSINTLMNKELKNKLRDANYNLISSRQIFVTDTENQSIFKTRIIKSDLKLWKESDYDVIDLTELTGKNKERILELYYMLCIESHTKLNPQFNLRFINLALENGLLRLKALMKNGTIEGVVGFMERDNTFLCPFIGYDKNHPDKVHIYRLLSTLLLLEANKKNQLFHQSAGASFYKSIRRAVRYQEYWGIYSRHLSFNQRFTWLLLQALRVPPPNFL